MRPIVIKLGGSAITRKDRVCTPRLDVIEHSAGEVAKSRSPVVLVHGGGSFAHPFVKRSQLDRGYEGAFQLLSVSETELFLDQLTRIVGVALLSKRIPFMPIRPGSIVTMHGNRITKSHLDAVRSALELGLLPLLHGDLAFNDGGGVSILSGDHLATFLGVRLNASRILFGCDVPGVYSADPKSSPKAKLVETVTKENYKSVVSIVRRSRGLDATGGMLNKVAEAVRAARLGFEATIFDLTEKENLGNLLGGEVSVGTRFVRWR